MKKILIIHPALVIGGVETVLINYLKILSELDNKYDVELLLLENRVNFNIGSIPKNISRIYSKWYRVRIFYLHILKSQQRE